MRMTLKRNPIQLMDRQRGVPDSLAAANNRQARERENPCKRPGRSMFRLRFHLYVSESKRMRTRPLYSFVLPALVALPAMAHAVAPNLHGAPSQAPATQAQIAALQQAVDNAQIGRRQCLGADFRGSGSADDRARTDALLWRSGAAQEHSGHHDAELRHDGADHRPVGDCRLLAGLRPRQRLHRRI